MTDFFEIYYCLLTDFSGHHPSQLTVDTDFVSIHRSLADVPHIDPSYRVKLDHPCVSYSMLSDAFTLTE